MIWCSLAKGCRGDGELVYSAVCLVLRPVAPAPHLHPQWGLSAPTSGLQGQCDTCVSSEPAAELVLKQGVDQARAAFCMRRGLGWVGGDTVICLAVSIFAASPWDWGEQEVVWLRGGA